MKQLKEYILESLSRIPKTIKATDLEDLYYKFIKLTKFNDDEFETFMQAEHMDGTGDEYNRELLSCIKKAGKKCPVRLYRGMSQKEFDAYQQGHYVVRCTSWSEDMNIAKNFGEVLAYIDDAQGLPYSQLLELYYKSMKNCDIDSYYEMDGDAILEESEKEWIIDAQDLVFRVMALE